MSSGNPFDFSTFSGSGASSSNPPDGSQSSADSRDARNPAGAFGRDGQSAFAFGSEREGGVQPSAVNGPPVVWLGVGLLLAVTGCALAVLLPQMPTALILAWILSGPAAIASFAVFSVQDIARRTSLFYASPSWVPILNRVGSVVILLCVIVVALLLASWIGRL